MARSESKQPQKSAGDDPFEAVLEDVVVGLGRLAWFLLKWSVLLPAVSVPIVAALVLGAMVSWWLGALMLAAAPLAYVLWQECSPDSFDRIIAQPTRATWREHRVYRSQWADVMALHGLTKELNGKILIPALLGVGVGKTLDALSVRLLTGQSPGDWQRQAEALAQAFKAESVCIRSIRPGEISVIVRRVDSLARPVLLPLPDEDSAVNVAALPVGVDEFGRSWRLRILGRHVLVAGATGSGKGSVVWSILAGLAPAIKTGVVQAWVVDPKGGMEFGSGQRLFARFSHDADGNTLALLRDAAAVMSERANRLRGVTRQHQPSWREPLIVLVIDELASLTAYATDRKIKTEIEQLLGLLLTQGRAVGVSVVGAVQDPGKETVALRQLFPTRVALRLSEPTQAAMVLGNCAREKGAPADLIPASTPGVGYVVEDESAEVIRVRAFHVTDEAIAYLARSFAPKRGTGELFS